MEKEHCKSSGAKAASKHVGEIDTWSQFHQHSTSSFYTCRSPKHKKGSQLKQLFALWGSAGVKAAPKHVDEIDP